MIQASTLLLAAVLFWLVICFGSTHQEPIEEPVPVPDRRDGHINELVNRAAMSSEPACPVIITRVPVLAGQPLQPEDLRIIKIPVSEIVDSDVPCIFFLIGRLAKRNIQTNHIISHHDLQPQGSENDWLAIHRAKRTILPHELFTEENTIERFVKISKKDSTQEILMHRATRKIDPGQIIKPADIDAEKWYSVWYAKRAIRKGELLSAKDIEMKLVTADVLDEEWNYADCSCVLTDSYPADKDIKCGAPIRCSDF